MAECDATMGDPIGGTLHCTLRKGHAGDHACVTPADQPEDGDTLHVWTDEIDALRDPRVEAGGNALYAAFPTLHEDFTAPWFYKAAEIVLKAAGSLPENEADLDAAEMHAAALQEEVSMLRGDLSHLKPCPRCGIPVETLYEVLMHDTHCLGKRDRMSP